MHPDGGGLYFLVSRSRAAIKPTGVVICVNGDDSWSKLGLSFVRGRGAAANDV